MHNLNIANVDKYLKEIFDLKNQNLDKELKIAVLQFELELQKHLYESIKNTSLQLLGWSF